MGKYNGPKRRLSRREGVALFKKDIKSIERKGAVPPGMRGTKSRSRFTEYGTQLREKQKAKRMFGLSEKQFRLTYEEAARVKEATGKKMLEFLETRLDNVVYRLGFAASRAQARQLVGHGQKAWDAVIKALGIENIEYTDYGGDMGKFITSFNGIKADSNQYFEFRVNGVSSSLGVSSYVCNNADKLEFVLVNF
jgi:uncharacterized protein (DUF2164 family)